ncbi:hypothetical protein [Heyndrickxia coagulans]|uniref:hypothetical protein n=1 Tax=Heyndrickxia coagulans TaxID=1398 RepID=UPI0018A7C397|nr:hypothetical protein [Heyndrickxia coagulans]MBF8418929.1 hypothetical protein [Heyndrickxia coagulans]
MAKAKQREKGETYRPVVKVLKLKNGVPTKVKFNGFEYALIHPDHINGRTGKQ